MSLHLAARGNALPRQAVLVFPLLAVSHGVAKRFTTPLPVMLNCYWFYLVCNNVMRMLRPATKKA